MDLKDRSKTFAFNLMKISQCVRFALEVYAKRIYRWVHFEKEGMNFCLEEIDAIGAVVVVHVFNH